MKIKVPKGIIVIVLLLLVSSLMSLLYFKPNNKFLFMGLLIQGDILTTYNTFNIITCLIVAVGLYLLKKWAYVIFFAGNISFILVSIGNMFLVQKDVLLESGLRDIDVLLMVHRIANVIGIIIGMVFICWIQIYRKYFFPKI